MTEIGMKVARSLHKQNMLNDNVALERIAEVIDDVAKIPLLCDIMSQLSGSEVFEKITSAAAKNKGTF